MAEQRHPGHHSTFWPRSLSRHVNTSMIANVYSGRPRQLLSGTVICMVLLCVLQECRGYVVKREGEQQMTKGTLEMAPAGHNIYLQEEHEVQPDTPDTMKPVSVDYFSSKLGEAETYHDVYRIFYGDDLSDELIDKLLVQVPTFAYGSSMHRAPRIGVLPEDHARLEDVTRAVHHTRLMETQTHCRDPVPEIVNVRALAHDANKVYFPSCTMVHRCRRHTGCCNGTSECAPKTNDTVRRAFIVGKYVKGTNGQMLLADQAVEILSFINHTECQCKPVKRIPTCLQCSYPFSLYRRNTTDCTCDCFPDHKTCNKIKRGRKALSELALRCIKDNRCARPTCEHGEFLQRNIITGYCPRADEVDELDESNSGNDSDPTLPDTSVVRSDVSRRALQ